jgi:hypothetical protein
MQNRRSRMHRTKTGKRLALTDRDMEIFRTLQRYRFLRSTYLHCFVGGASGKRFVERLGDLFHEGYLDRPAEQWRFADARCRPVVYELGKGGIEAAGAATEAETVTWFRNGPHRQFEHTLMVCEVLASIELATRGREDIRFIPWSDILVKTPEATRRSSKPYALSAANGNTVVPDAIFGLEYHRDGRRAYRFFALEADRGTMPIARAASSGTSLLEKVESYRRIIERGAYHQSLGVPNLLVLTVTTSETRCAEMVAKCAALMADGRALLLSSFAGATAPDPNLLSAPWQRPGAPPLYIGQ